MGIVVPVNGRTRNIYCKEKLSCILPMLLEEPSSGDDLHGVRYGTYRSMILEFTDRDPDSLCRFWREPLGAKVFVLEEIVDE